MKMSNDQNAKATNKVMRVYLGCGCCSGLTNIYP